MSKAAEYRRFAEECLHIAVTASADQRRMLIEMARAWHQLAQERERSEQLAIAEAKIQN
jgi:hypothetical protein